MYANYNQLYLTEQEKQKQMDHFFQNKLFLLHFLYNINGETMHFKM